MSFKILEKAVNAVIQYKPALNQTELLFILKVILEKKIQRTIGPTNCLPAILIPNVK